MSGLYPSWSTLSSYLYEREEVRITFLRNIYASRVELIYDRNNLPDGFFFVNLGPVPELQA